MTHEALPPNQTIGIIGGGQLGRMLTLAAAKLGFKIHIYSDADDAPATQIATSSTIGAYDDAKKLAQFADNVQCITYEFENIPSNILSQLQAQSQAKLPILPPVQALAISQDRLEEKNFIRAQGLAVADFMPITSTENIDAARDAFGGAGILKTRHFGYDGKNQWRVNNESAPAALMDTLAGRPAIMEKIITFEREISILAARNVQGDIAFYEPVENLHKNHILHSSTMPARLSDAQHKQAHHIADTLIRALNYVGVLAIEIFVTDTGLVVNEIAPRVHNSGHLTADACICGQFEQHIRAIAGWPLGNPHRHSDAVMTNLLGDDVADWRKLAAQPQNRLHLYGKSEARAGRKMGHITQLSPKTN